MTDDSISANTPVTVAGMEVSLQTQRTSDLELVKSCVNIFVFKKQKFVQAHQLNPSSNPKSLCHRIAGWCARSTDDNWKAAWQSGLKNLVMRQLHAQRANKARRLKEVVFRKYITNTNVAM